MKLKENVWAAVKSHWEEWRMRVAFREMLPGMYEHTAKHLKEEHERAERLLQQLAEARALLRDDATPTNPVDIERLARLVEACGSVVERAGRIQRFGWHTVAPHSLATNKVLLERDLGRVCAVIEILIQADDIRGTDVKHWSHKIRSGIERAQQQNAR